MASPQLEEGHTRIANEILDALCRTRIPGEARQVFDVIFRRTYGWRKKFDQIPLSQFVKMTGIQRRHVVRAIKTLEAMNLIFVERKCEKLSGIDNSEKTLHSTTTYRINKDYDSWVVPKKAQGAVPNKELRVVPKKEPGVVPKTLKRVVPKKAHSKESISKESIKENILSDKSDPAPLKSSKSQNIPFAEIIEHLNQKTGKNFRANSKGTQSHIRARFAEGFSLAEFIKVIDKKSAKWACDPKMADYLRPETLFGPKFEAYLNESGEITSSPNWMREFRADDPTIHSDPKDY
ncbi:MAG: conserved phage C-terminal domain-containing protein [Deltaproteobacteria bacterium]|nr:conserved phage C-terminal domain-containing protein [Deltaproteobacteria bacterium]